MRNAFWVWAWLGLTACGGEEHQALSGVAAVSVGPNHACARLETGAVRCWGNNYSGQLGDGTSSDSLEAISVSGITSAHDISANGDSSCAVLADGTAKCWGVTFVPSSAPLSTRSLLPEYGSAFPHVVPGIGLAKAISSGSLYHTCVLETERVLCWGRNQFGQLGNGAVDETSDPVIVSGISDAVSVGAGGFQSCAVLADGHVRCWGSGVDGVLGEGRNDYEKEPVELNGIVDAVAVTVGDFHACALRATGAVVCWGRNHEFELGSDSAGDYPTAPVDVDGLSDVVSLSAGFDHTCAVIVDGTVWCWGGNSDGELGSGAKSERELVIQVRGIATAESVAVGAGTSCAVLRDHTVRCWGRNTYGALGNGTTQDSLSPVTVLAR